jgi:lysophospholipase L1-like esterase
MTRRALIVTLVVGLGSFGLGYFVAMGKRLPSDPIEAVGHSSSAPASDVESSYWREKTSFFEAFATRASVVMIGDSLTDGAEWGEMFPGVAVVNRGIDGDTARGILLRMRSILSVHARKAFVMAGINDFAKEDRPVDAVFGDYRKIVSQLEATGARVLVQSTLVCNAAMAGWIRCDAIQERIRQLNARLATLVSPHVGYIDLNAALAGKEGLKAEFTFDGVHLNGAGYRIWRREISNELLSP